MNYHENTKFRKHEINYQRYNNNFFFVVFVPSWLNFLSKELR